jgi:hypothetical protein
MWVFYYDVTQAAEQIPNDTVAFISVGIVTALLVLIPPYMEKRRNESR